MVVVLIITFINISEILLFAPRQNTHEADQHSAGRSRRSWWPLRGAWTGSEALQGDSAAQVLSCDRAGRGGSRASAQWVRVQECFLQGGGPWKLFVKDSPYPHSRSYF